MTYAVRMRDAPTHASTARRRLSAALVAAPLLGLAFAPLSRAAPPAGKVLRIGYLSPSTGNTLMRDALRELGYVEPDNIVMEIRFAEGKMEQLPRLAAELVAARVDVIVAASPPAIQAAKDATTTIPIVMAFTSVDPIESKFVESLARPGKNITGVAMIADRIAGKRLEKLKEMVPGAKRIAVLMQTNHSAGPGQLEAARAAATTLGIEVHEVRARDARDYEKIFADVGKRAQAMFVVANPTFAEDRKLLAELAIKHRVPMLCEWRQMAEEGCLLAYGPDITELNRRVVGYVDRIANGAQPAELPVEQPTKFQLFINPDTARKLGIVVPQALLLQAELVRAREVR